MDIVFAVPAPAHADHVEADQIRERALDEAERNHVGAHPAQANHHRALPDTHELTHRGLAAEHDKVADRHVTAQHHVVGEDHVIADFAVEAHMGADHPPTAISHLCDTVDIICESVDCQ